ncbi:hypothetical protein CCM_08388 [Cordyceps militaris CM01]|uniref:Uncharacterized protein n=1 Tax=Cordyceps militaris (strain CM01) TaxID=983644 RepID=G3JR49_CORMM|nr:uncharacterized protein CCM_08388 [Cordyceps militaris CM01]EGX88345.1 hypothetical protein CCM_08388 [Cordyceps militaris CM01]
MTRSAANLQPSAFALPGLPTTERGDLSVTGGRRLGAFQSPPLNLRSPSQLASRLFMRKDTHLGGTISANWTACPGITDLHQFGPWSQAPRRTFSGRRWSLLVPVAGRIASIRKFVQRGDFNPGPTTVRLYEASFLNRSAMSCLGTKIVPAHCNESHRYESAVVSVVSAAGTVVCVVIASSDATTCCAMLGRTGAHSIVCTCWQCCTVMCRGLGAVQKLTVDDASRATDRPGICRM